MKVPVQMPKNRNLLELNQLLTIQFAGIVIALAMPCVDAFAW